LTVFEKVVQFVFCKDEALAVEAARTVGNLSRVRAVRASLAEPNSLRRLVNAASTAATGDAEGVQPSPELAHALAGTFVNLVADPPLREAFLSGCGGPALCARLLARAAEDRDWPLATLVCQLLWNALADPSVGAATAEETMVDLAEALEELLLLAEDDGGGQAESASVAEFRGVAVQLLERGLAGMDEEEEETDPRGNDN